MNKARIIERTYPSGQIEYVIQIRRMIFKNKWKDATRLTCRSDGSLTLESASFETPEEAKQEICWHDGTRTIERAITIERVIE